MRRASGKGQRATLISAVGATRNLLDTLEEGAPGMISVLADHGDEYTCMSLDAEYTCSWLGTHTGCSGDGSSFEDGTHASSKEITDNVTDEPCTYVG